MSMRQGHDLYRLTPEERARADRAIRALVSFFHAMPRATVSDLAMLLSVAAHEEQQGYHGERLGLDKSTASAIIRRLGPGGRGEVRAGLEWVKYVSDPDDDRRKVPVLTPLGFQVVSNLMNALVPE